MERVQLYNFSTEHIPGQTHKVCDALSRMCKSVPGYSRYDPNRPPRLMDLSKRLAKHDKQLKFFDPLCQEMVEEASFDHEYLEMLVTIEIKIDPRYLSDQELRKLSG